MNEKSDLDTRNKINEVLQSLDVVAYEVTLGNGEKITYFSPKHIKDNVATDIRIKKGIFDTA